MANGGFRFARTQLPEAVVESLLDRGNNGNVGSITPPQSVIDAARDAMDGGPGHIVLSIAPDITEDMAAAVMSTVSGWFGELTPQDATGRLVRRVEDRGTRIGEGTSRYADSRFGGSLHTDGAEAPMPVPDYFALLCVRRAARGGALQLAHLTDVVPALQAAGAETVLREPFHFDRRDDAAAGEPPTVVKPILFRYDDRDGITYLREYVEAGHAKPGVPDLTPRQRAALDVLDRALADPAVVRSDVLAPGEIGLFDNRRVLHGRTTFDDDARVGSRLLLRTWLRRRGAP